MPTPEDIQKADEFLQEVIIELELYGWCQGRVMDPEGRQCLTGAIFNHRINSNHYTPCQRKLATAALYEVPEIITSGNIVLFNDAAGRTFEEIIAALQSARNLLKQKGTF